MSQTILFKSQFASSLLFGFWTCSSLSHPHSHRHPHLFFSEFCFFIYIFGFKGCDWFRQQCAPYFNLFSKRLNGKCNSEIWTYTVVLLAFWGLWEIYRSKTCKCAKWKADCLQQTDFFLSREVLLFTAFERIQTCLKIKQDEYLSEPHIYFLMSPLVLINAFVWKDSFFILNTGWGG